MKTNLSIEIGNNLKQLRNSAKFTQKDVADALFMTQQQYSRFETGVYELNYEQITKLCKLFDCTPNEIYGIYEK